MNTKTSSNENRAIFSHNDIWTGLILLFVGLGAAWLATDFDDASRAYPLALSLLMAILGLIIIIKVFLGKAKHVSFAVPSKVTATAGAIIILWIVAITQGLGYILPTFLMELAFLLVCGFRGLSKSIIVAALISIVSYLLFIVALGVRIPEPLQPWLL